VPSGDGDFLVGLTLLVVELVFSGEASAGSAVGATAEGGVALRLSESDFLDEELIERSCSRGAR